MGSVRSQTTIGYQDFPSGTDEAKTLSAILDEAWKKDLRFLTNQDLGAHPRVDQWSNGTDPAAELNRLMDIRRVALKNFGESSIRKGEPLALMEEALLPLYLHHRYQVEAAAHALGGQHYIYALRGDDREPFRWAPGAEQHADLKSLLATIKPSELTLLNSVLKRLPPRPSRYRAHRELFPRYTGITFDMITPAAVASYYTVSNILDDLRAARLVELLAATFGAAPATPFEAEIARAVQRVAVEELMALAAAAEMPQVRAIATLKFLRRLDELAELSPTDVPTQHTWRCWNATSSGFWRTRSRTSAPRRPYCRPAPRSATSLSTGSNTN